MWPDAFEAWSTACEPEAVRTVYGRLVQYPVLKVFADRTSRSGVARTREIGQYLRSSAGYFAHRPEFCRWFRIVSYREALRLVLSLEPVEMILEHLEGEARRLLRYRYIDQLTDDEVARMLELRTNNWQLFDAEAARRRSLDAYLQLCAALEKRFSQTDTPRSGPNRDPSLMFPLFPGVYRSECRPSAPGGKG
jgi:hypothetical protein